MFPHHVIDMRSPAICEENFNSCQRHTQWKNLQHCTNGSFPLMSSLCIMFVWGYVCLCKHLCVSCRITVTFVTALEPRTTECNSGTSVPWFQYQHRCFPGSFDPKWFEKPLHVPDACAKSISPHHFLTWQTAQEPLSWKPEHLPPELGSCQPVLLLYALRFWLCSEPLSARLMHDPSSVIDTVKLNAALRFASFDNSTEKILAENEMKWQRFSVSTVSPKPTLQQKTSENTSNRPEPQNDKSLNCCCYRLSLIPQS